MNRDDFPNRSGKFIKGAAILSVTGIIAKLLGAVFRIPLNNWIGAEGMSYYGVAYPVYSFFLIIATAGLPVAISKMVSERIAIGDYANAHRTYRVSLRLMTVLGAIGFAICFFGAELIAEWSGNAGGAASLRAISLALLTAPIVSSFRGYSQGQQQMLPTGASEIMEQILRVIAGLSLSYLFLRTGFGLEQAAAGATFGASAGSIAALLLLLAIYFSKRKERRAHIAASVRRQESTRSLFKALLRIAVPITIGSAILPLMMIIDMAVVMNRLQATGWSGSESRVLYGLISGFCDPLISFPQVFTTAVAVSLVPAISAAYVRKDTEDVSRNINAGIKMSMIISTPCMIGLIVLAQPILFLLYPAQQEQAAMATLTLQVMSLGVAVFAILRTFSSVLQGIGRPGIPVRNLLLGVGCKFVITYILVGIPAVNISGAAAGNVAAYAVTAFLNYRAVHRLTGVSVSFSDNFGRPLLASLIMGGFTLLTYRVAYWGTGHNSVAALIAILIAVLVYAVVIFPLGCVNREDIQLLPRGNALLRLTDALHLTKK